MKCKAPFSLHRQLLPGSQMAEAIVNARLGEGWEAYSTSTKTGRLRTSAGLGCPGRNRHPARGPLQTCR